MFGTSAVFATNILARFLSLGLFLLLVRNVPKEQFGDYAYLIIKAATISSFFLSPLGVVAARFSGDSGRDRGAVVGYIAAQSIVTTLLLIPASVFVDWITAPSLVTGWFSPLLIFVAAAGLGIFQIVQSLLYGLREYQRAAIFTIAVPVLQLLIVASSLLLYGSVTLASLCAAICCTLLVCVTSIALWRKRLAPSPYPASVRRELLKFQWPFFFSSVITSPVGLAVASLLLKLTNLAEVARYNVCLQIGSLAVSVVLAMYPYYISRLSRASDGVKELLRATAELGVLLIGVFVAYRISAVWILSVVLPQYVDIVSAATPFVIWGCVLGLRMPATAFLDSKGKAWLNFVVTTCGSCFLIAASVVLVRYDLVGLGWARSLAAIFEAILTAAIIMWSLKKAAAKTPVHDVT